MLVVTREKLEASICRDSFTEFVKRFWSSIIPEDPVWNWHIPFLCDELQALAERVFKREPKLHDLIINISPGSTKSTICSVMFPAWCWVRDATIRSICGSYAFPLSLHLAMQSRRIIQSDKFRTLFPEVVLEGEGKGLLITDKGGLRFATSTGGSVTGMHGHFIIIDDPINPKDAVSKAMLKSANEWFDHTLMTRKIDKEVTPTILIMQRLHQDDPTGHLLAHRSADAIRHICLPAELTPNVRPRCMRKKYIEGLMDPIRLKRTSLDAAKTELGQFAYAGQFLQSPIPLGGGMFKIELIQVGPAPKTFMKVVRYWDKAGTGGGGKYTVGVKMGQTYDKRFWILDVVRGQWEAFEREKIIRQIAEMDGREVIVAVEQEPGSGGKESAQSTVKNLAGFRVRVDRPTGDKVLRADPFAVQVNGANVSIAAGAWNRPYLDEMQYFPFSTYMDQMDASSGAFNQIASIRRKVGSL